ncbi:hypothetical protein RUM43_012749 [Polyplax serrata]|uniref:Uncharacterized protein n=1 Tax=Polyplax serrata TaxID=468196 RepID=A0AAN8NYG0_POLSC
MKTIIKKIQNTNLLGVFLPKKKGGRNPEKKDKDRKTSQGKVTRLRKQSGVEPILPGPEERKLIVEKYRRGEFVFQVK